MNYYNEELTKDIHPVNKEYQSITNPNQLYELLEKCWCKQTCAPRMQEEWSENNKTKGQCSITAFLVQDIFGGEVYGIDLKDGNYHCYNVVNDVIFDITASQFKHALEYNKQNKQNRSKHFSKEEKYNRYLLLKDKLKNLIKK